VQSTGPTVPIPGGINNGKLRIKVSGRKFLDLDHGLGTTDPYFELFLSGDGGLTKTKIIRSDTVSDKEDPDWGTAIEIDFNRAHNQWLLFNVWDADNLRDDDRVGSAWINLADYVDAGQSKTAFLDKIGSGYLIIQAADARQTNPGISHNATTTRLNSTARQTIGTGSQIVRFKLAASGLPTKDDIGFIPGNSDPYVICYLKEGLSGKENEFGRSGTVSATRTPAWGDVFTFSWDKTKNQRIVFRIYDEDNLREDSKLGVAWIDGDDLIMKATAYSIPLVKKGIITITKM